MTPLPSGFADRPFAHRGLHGPERPENSRAACAAAAAAGYGIEIDLQLSADGEAMVFHDYDLDRMTAETGPVSAHSAHALGRMALSGGEETIPTLLDILDLVGGRVPLLVEVKDQSRQMGPVDGRLERRAARCLAAYDGPVALMSFNPHSVALCREAAPDIPRGRVTLDFHKIDECPADRAEALGRIDDLDALGASFISHHHVDLPNQAAARARASGVKVFCWTIRSAEEAARAAPHVDAITFEHFPA